MVQNILNAELTEIKHLLLMNSKNVLTSTEVSMMYGISPDYLYHLTSDKLIPYYKPNGKKIYFLKEEIETWLLRNRQDTVDEMQQQVVVRDLKNNKRWLWRIYIIKRTYRQPMTTCVTPIRWIHLGGYPVISEGIFDVILIWF